MDAHPLLPRQRRRQRSRVSLYCIVIANTGPRWPDCLR